MDNAAHPRTPIIMKNVNNGFLWFLLALSLDAPTESVFPILLGEIDGFDTVAAYEAVYTGTAQETGHSSKLRELSREKF